MNDICAIVLYTTDNVLEFNVKATVVNFDEVIADALEGGTVVLDTIDESKLILNAINVVAVEIRQKEFPPIP